MPKVKKTYKLLKLKEQILLNPDMYIGSVAEYSVERFVYDTETEKLKKIKMKTIDGVERLFMEVLSNATDAILDTKNNKIKTKGIVVTLDDNKVTIRNYGIPIPITKDKKENMWNPEMIFGVLLTSSNYDTSKDREGAGKNGYGAKLCNVFSTEFSCRVGNKKGDKNYFQKWSNNMNDMSDPKITEKKTEDFVEISYSIDFTRFKGKKENYSKEMIELFIYHCCMASAFCETKVSVEVSTKKIKYSKIFDLSASDIHNIIPGALSTLSFEYSKNDITSRIALIDVKEGGGCISYTNGIENVNGGKHIDSLYNGAKKAILDIISSRKKEEDKKKGGRVVIQKGRFMESITIICFTCCKNPLFDSQSKTKLTFPVFSIPIPEEQQKKMTKWNIANQIAIAIQNISMNKANKDSKTNKKGFFVPKVDDANLAGKKPESCTLFIVEGDSAKGYPESMISNMKNGRDFIGIFPLQGKPLNSLNADPIDILENEVFAKLRKVLGLEEGKEYDDPKPLRYHKVEILVDADEDGKHILGLIVLFFFTRFRSLLRHKFLYYLRTPIIRATRGTKKKAFFSKTEFDDWKEKTEGSEHYTVHYFKGLGSSGDDDVSEDIESVRSVLIIDDDDSNKAIDLAFNEIKGFTEQRKEWLRHLITDAVTSKSKKMTIDSMIHKEVGQHSIANNNRSLPAFDGLKISQRKALWTAIKHSSSTKPISFLQFVGEIMKHTSYAHGDKSICDAIILMTQNCVGTNNLPYFNAKGGQYGNRTKGPKGAAHPRYLKTVNMKWLPLVFRAEDEKILSFTYEHGEKAEPKVLLPIIPLILINGAKGVGTGWSTTIPSYSIDDCIEWLLYRLKGSSGKEPKIRPWNRHFIGKTKVSEDNIVYKGLYKFDKEADTLSITEAPVGIFSEKIKNALDALRKEKKITSYRRNDSINVVDFVVSGVSGIGTRKEILSALKMVKNISTRNMNILSEECVVKEYSNVKDVIASFYDFRLPYYGKRKQYYLDEYIRKITLIEQKLKLLKLYMNNTIVPKGKKKVDLLEIVASYGISDEAFNGCRFEDCCDDEIDKLKTMLKKLKEEKEELERQTPENLWEVDINNFVRWYKKNIEEFDLYVPKKQVKTYGKRSNKKSSQK